ncbi:hypothetical protein NDU88_002983 [Pleurodeles waltl]|uniref:Uncharacterized protein n=1 Tax=Pleurodeles waltl TaxID=8319 RepID=A0AAV7W157_PLEWA|nr:hypothetical protein NDU88_002983 [Pleurodeles waltl]
MQKSSDAHLSFPAYSSSEVRQLRATRYDPRSLDRAAVRVRQTPDLTSSGLNPRAPEASSSWTDVAECRSLTKRTSPRT